MLIADLQGPRGSSGSWPWWMLATAAGSTIGALMGGALISASLQPFAPVDSPLETALVGIPRIAGALGVWGAGIGSMQWLMLRRHVVRAYWWPLATISGWATAGAVSGALPIGGAVTGRGVDIGPVGFVAVGVVTVLALGFLSGLFQWFILRQQTDQAGGWVWTTAGSIALAMLSAALILAQMSASGWLGPADFPSAASWGVAGVVVGLVYGALSGQMLTRLRHA